MVSYCWFDALALIMQTSLLVCFYFNKYITDSGGSISSDRLGVWVNVEHRMLQYVNTIQALGFSSDWLHVQGVVTPFLYVQGVALPLFYNGKG